MTVDFETSRTYYEEWTDLVRAMLGRDASASSHWNELAARENDYGDVPLVMLKQRLNLTEFEAFAVILAFAFEAEPELARIHGEPPSYNLAIRLFEDFRASPDKYLLRSSLRLDAVLQSGWDQEWLRLTRTAYHLLCGFVPQLTGCTHELHSGLPDILGDIGTFIELERCMEFALTGSPVTAALFGSEGSGRCFHIKKLCEARGLPLLEIDGEVLPDAEDDREHLLNDIYLTLKLSFSAVCLRRYERKLRKFAVRLLEVTPFLALTLRTGEEPPEFGPEVLSVRYTMPEFTLRQRHLVWDYFMKRYKTVPGFDMHVVGNQYRLTAGDIERVTRKMALRRDAGLTCGEAEMRSIIEQVRFVGSGSRLAKLIRPKFSWEDLIVPVELLGRLREICQRVRFADKVLDEWAFSSKYPYGAGLSVLFYGSPGTGKTMAAHVLANELQIPLLHVDFSNMIDKYIGETEKHILELFEQARQMSAILFFDEADALFSQRTEASDATDRYANAQTACLLQCVEEYDGMVILSTNLLSNFDEAFRRRIRYFIHFFHPDETSRRAIWESAFPPQAALSPDVDFATLAKQELSAGSIKNIVLTAAYLAAEKGQIEMEHLTSAYQIERVKDGGTADSYDDVWL